ncbi:MAG: bifunctional folylpolyglutamate synthase/dihydrofolate synthase [Alloprevotella sp.]|nr:bifunctional folylpolyglutamate synthase/dihydrofolate synthase [Alloprevotella sp.]
MTYQQTLDYLYTAAPLFQQQGAAAYKPGLQTTHALDAHFAHPHRHYPTLHVAGTNGKGSCAHTLAAILQAGGLRVGLYTSPHLRDFRERIRINDEPIPEQRVVDFVARERDFFEPLAPSFFELTTALALQYFAESRVDAAVIEVGLGGRLDSTNIITPQLSLITNISLEHTDLLGDTLAAIAAEKAGIIKPGVPALIGEALPETRPVFEAVARKVCAPLTFAEEQPEVLDARTLPDGTMQYATRTYGTVCGQLSGDCQARNANTILRALPLLRNTPLAKAITPESVRRGFAEVCALTGLEGRWQILRRSPTLVCDTGHNAGGWAYLSRRLHHIAAEGELHIVFGMASDKDVATVLSLLPKQAHYYWAQASVRRALPADELARLATQAGLPAAATYASVPEAVRAALRAASPEATLFVGGSSFIVADLLSHEDCIKDNA